MELFASSPQNKSVCQGEVAVMFCQARNNNSEVHWLFNDSPLQTSNAAYMPNELAHSLLVFSWTLEVSGKYTCIVKERVERVDKVDRVNGRFRTDRRDAWLQVVSERNCATFGVGKVQVKESSSLISTSSIQTEKKISNTEAGKISLCLNKWIFDCKYGHF